MNAKLKSHYKDTKALWELKYGTKNLLLHRMNSILVQAWGASKVSTENIIRGSSVKTNIPPLSPTKFTTNMQECVASVQVSYGAKYE